MGLQVNTTERDRENESEGVCKREADCLVIHCLEKRIPCEVDSKEVCGCVFNLILIE